MQPLLKDNQWEKLTNLIDRFVTRLTKIWFDQSFSCMYIWCIFRWGWSNKCLDEQHKLQACNFKKLQFFTCTVIIGSDTWLMRLIRSIVMQWFPLNFTKYFTINSMSPYKANLSSLLLFVNVENQLDINSVTLWMMYMFFIFKNIGFWMKFSQKIWFLF